MSSILRTTIIAFIIASFISISYISSINDLGIILPNIKDILVVFPICIIIAFLQFKCLNNIIDNMKTFSKNQKNIKFYLGLTKETLYGRILWLSYLLLYVFETAVILILTEIINMRSKYLFQFTPFVITPILVFIISTLSLLKSYFTRK